MQTANMEHRHSTSHTQMSETDHEQIWNHWQNDRRLNLGNGSFMFPADNIASNRVNSVAYFNPTLRPNDLQLSNHSSEIPRYVIVNTGTSFDPHIHLPSARSISQLPPHSVQHGSSYSQPALPDVRSNFNSLMDYERAAYKRKHPANSMFPDRGSRNGYYSAGSSSNPIMLSENLHAKPVSDSQCWPWDPASFVHSYRSDNASSSNEGSQRNVRSRHGNAIHLEDTSSGISSNNNFSHHFHSIAITPGSGMAGQWSHTPLSVHPNARVSSSVAGIGSFNHEINQSYVTSHVTNNNMETDGGYSSYLVPFPTAGPSPRGLVVGPSSYGQRADYRVNPTYPSVGMAATSEDVRLPRVESAVPSRYSTPLSILRQSNERNGRTRNRYNRLHMISDEDTAHIRRMPEGVAMMDRSAFYDPMHYLDQHHDMRLDVDNMSYEELLALEERIGNVSTGLSEDAIPQCLVETIYFFTGQGQDNQEEDSCPICLEAYKDRDNLGTLKCKHIFHSSCIRKWLQIKNICPICKASAMDDTPKET